MQIKIEAESISGQFSNKGFSVAGAEYNFLFRETPGSRDITLVQVGRFEGGMGSGFEALFGFKTDWIDVMDILLMCATLTMVPR